MADPKRDAPHHPPHPGNYAGKIPDSRAGGGGGRRILVIVAVLILAMAAVWFLIGGGDQLGESTLGEPAGVGEAATAVDREANEPELPHGEIGEASEADAVLAPDAIDQEEGATGPTEAE